MSRSISAEVPGAMITQWGDLPPSPKVPVTSAPVPGVENFGRAKGGRGRSSAAMSDFGSIRREQTTARPFFWRMGDSRRRGAYAVTLRLGKKRATATSHQEHGHRRRVHYRSCEVALQKPQAV